MPATSTDDVTGEGVRYAHGQQVDADEATQLRRTVTSPDGTVVTHGADVVAGEPQGRVSGASTFVGRE